MEHYVTLFDSNYLPQGLSLHMSMERHVKNYTLWILCVDAEAYQVLIKLRLPNVRLLDLRYLETEELLQVKPSRSKGEYCWTLTPFSIRFVFEACIEVQRVTYIDADLWFRKSPDIIFKELESAGKSVLITDHGYAPEYDQSEKSGQYCVQFVTFERLKGEKVRKWWEERCIEWCFAKYEDGKFGDQKYLDDWPIRFPSEVHVLGNKGLSLAPWNAISFPYGGSVFYHFHSFKVGGIILLCEGYSIPRHVLKNIYSIYLKDIKQSLIDLKNSGYEHRYQISNVALMRICAVNILKNIYKFINAFNTVYISSKI